MNDDTQRHDALQALTDEAIEAGSYGEPAPDMRGEDMPQELIDLARAKATEEALSWTKDFPDDRSLVAVRMSCGHAKISIRNVPNMIGLTTNCPACHGDATVVREIAGGGTPDRAEIERQVRAKVAEELREDARKWSASVKVTHPLDARERRHAIAAGLTQAADRVARGERP